MLGAVRVELLSSGLLPGSLPSFLLLLAAFPMLWGCKVHSVDCALVPYGVASALVAMDSFLFFALVAMDGSEAGLDL